MLVPYHIEHSDGYYSLSFVNEDPEIVSERASAYDGATTAVTTQYVGDTSVNAIYTDINPTWELNPVPLPREVDSPIRAALNEVFFGVEQTADDTRTKTYDGDKIAESIARVEWKESVRSVSAQLLSNLLIGHGLPNGNHRSSIGLIDLYFRTLGVSNPIPRVLAEDEDAVISFVRDSKRLLTLGRSLGMFRPLSDAGIAGVVRKNGVEIWFDEYDLSELSPNEIRDRHRRRCRDFTGYIISVLEEDELLEQRDDGKHTFEQRLESMNVEDVAIGEKVASLPD